MIGYPGRIPRGSKTSPTLLHFKSHLRVTFLFVICRAYAFRIGKDEHPVAMHDRLSGCVQLIFKVIVCLTSCDIDICFTLKGMELVSEGNTLYLTGKLCSCQLM